MKSWRIQFNNSHFKTTSRLISWITLTSCYCACWIQIAQESQFSMQKINNIVKMLIWYFELLSTWNSTFFDDSCQNRCLMQHSIAFVVLNSVTSLLVHENCYDMYDIGPWNVSFSWIWIRCNILTWKMALLKFLIKYSIFKNCV